MKYILTALGTVIFILFLFPVTLNVLNFANILGMIFSAIVIFYGRFFSQINTSVKSFWKKRNGKAVLCTLSVTVSAVLVVVITISAMMFSAANNPPHKETTVVALGCKVNPNGPSIMLTTRLEAAYDFLTENKASKCVLSGGQGADEVMSEAQAMYDWLTEKGIDKSRLFIEDQSTSTEENLLYSKEIIEKNSLCPDITVITNEFHQYRAGKIADRLGIESYGYYAKTPFYLFPTYYVRELFAIIYEFIS